MSLLFMNGMRFSDYLFRHLYQHHVLSCSEYDTLLCCFESERVHTTMNKKLIDVINLKPQQLQELFVAQLFLYQAQLFPTLTGESCYRL